MVSWMAQTYKQLDTRTAYVMLLAMQIFCWAGFFTAEYGLFNAAEYEMYIGIALINLLGFGSVMASVYGLGAVGFAFMITCMCVQMNMFFAARIPNDSRLTVGSYTLADGNFAAIPVLIRWVCMRSPKPALAPPGRRMSARSGRLSTPTGGHPGRPLKRSPRAL